jgi:hypothetical protein
LIITNPCLIELLLEARMIFRSLEQAIVGHRRNAFFFFKAVRRWRFLCEFQVEVSRVDISIVSKAKTSKEFASALDIANEDGPAKAKLSSFIIIITNTNTNRFIIITIVYGGMCLYQHNHLPDSMRSNSSSMPKTRADG